MKFSCYCHDNPKNMKMLIYSFAKDKETLVIEMFYISYMDGNLEEDKLRVYLDIDDLMYYPHLKDFYHLSLLLTENPNKLTYNDNGFYGFSDHTWGVNCRKYVVGKGFTDDFSCNYGFSEHPSVMFNKISKQNKSFIKYNKFCLRYYKDIYQNVLNSRTYLKIFLDAEIKKIDQELTEFDNRIHQTVMKYNIDIIHEVLPSDLVNYIESLAA